MNGPEIPHVDPSFFDPLNDFELQWALLSNASNLAHATTTIRAAELPEIPVTEDQLQSAVQMRDESSVMLIAYLYGYQESYFNKLSENMQGGREHILLFSWQATWAKLRDAVASEGHKIATFFDELIQFEFPVTYQADMAWRGQADNPDASVRAFYEVFGEHFPPVRPVTDDE